MSTIERYGVAGGTGTGGQHLPFARAAGADGWLFVSGQVPMESGEVVEGGIVPQAHKAIQNLLAILAEAGYGPQDVVRCGVWLDDARDFPSFNRVFREYFGEHPPARVRGLQHCSGLQGGDRLCGVQEALGPRTLVRYDDNRADIAGAMARTVSELL